MWMIKPTLTLFVFSIVQFFFADDALAWGPGIHTVTGLISLNDVTGILPSIARIVTAFPREYLYGCLAADFFIGKSKRKRANHLHNWEGGYRVLSEAGDDRERAYAYGFLSHLAADVVAHNFFIPGLINHYPGRKRVGHLYSEIKADFLVGPGYIRIAADILSTDHRKCDQLLKSLTGKKRNGLKTQKHLFTQSVRLSDYLCASHPMLFVGRKMGREMFHNYLALMLNMSCRLIRDLLTHPDSSPCLLYDPLGRRSLRLAKRNRRLSLLFRQRPPIQEFRVDETLLNL